MGHIRNKYALFNKQISNPDTVFYLICKYYCWKLTNHNHLWHRTTKPILSRWGIFLGIAKNAKNHIKNQYIKTWLVISIAKNFIWTTLKLIFSVFRFFAPSNSRFSNSCISAKYCPILTNHTSMESLFIQLSDYDNLKQLTGFVVFVLTRHQSILHINQLLKHLKQFKCIWLKKEWNCMYITYALTSLEGVETPFCFYYDTIN